MFAISKPCFKAEFTMKVLLEVFLLLIVYSQIYPFIEEYLQITINNSDPTTAALLTILPFIIAAMIILGVIGYNLIGGRRR